MKCDKHCWHDTGKVLTSNPPQIEKICCKCGETINVREIKFTDKNEHGNYKPN